MSSSLNDLLRELECQELPTVQVKLSEEKKKPVDWKHLFEKGYINDVVNPKTGHDYLLTDYLGAGSFGAVFRAYNVDLGIYFAIKFLNLIDGQHDDFNREIEAHYYLSRTPSCQSHIVCLYEAFIIPDITMIYVSNRIPNYAVGVLVSELMDGDLTTIKVSASQIPTLILDLVEGLDFIHRNGFSHRDIKPANVLVKEEVYKFGDLGMMCRDDAIVSNESCIYLGTPVYLAPEAIRYWNQSVPVEDCQRSDVWMLGVTLFRIIFNKYPFNAIKNDKSYSYITSLTQDDITAQFQTVSPPKTNVIDLEGPQIMTLLEAMLQVDPTTRASASDLKVYLDTLALSSSQPTDGGRSYVSAKSEIQEAIPPCSSNQAKRNVRVLLQEIEMASLDLIRSNRFRYAEHVRNIEKLLSDPDRRCLDIPYLEQIYRIYHDDIVTRKGFGAPDNLVILGDILMKEIDGLVQ